MDFRNVSRITSCIWITHETNFDVNLHIQAYFDSYNSQRLFTNLCLRLHASRNSGGCGKVAPIFPGLSRKSSKPLSSANELEVQRFGWNGLHGRQQASPTDRRIYCCKNQGRLCLRHQESRKISYAIRGAFHAIYMVPRLHLYWSTR